MKHLSRKKYKLLIPLFLILSVILISACSEKEPPFIRVSDKIDYNIEDYNTIPNNPIPGLSVPTQITKIGDDYIIVDCYNNQVIYNDNLTDPVYEWFIMTTDINRGHTIASDGVVYLIDDTENNRILIMEKTTNLNNMPVFVPTQEFNDIGTRPHYIVYDEKSKTFYAWSSMTGQMYLFRRKADSSEVYLSEILEIPELNGFYVRSFTIIDDMIYFVSGNSNIIEAKLKNFEIVKRYPVPDEIAGMVQLTKIDDYYYITISTDLYGSQDAATIIRTDSLDKLMAHDYQDVYDHFIGGGTPYCITQIDDTFYLCEHRLPGHSIWSFKVMDNEICEETTVY